MGMAQAPGRWLADAETLEKLGVRAGGPVDGADFIALMEGRHPGSGRWLRPEGAGGGRGDVQRTEVRLDYVGARRPVAARADRAGPRQGGKPTERRGPQPVG